MKIQVTLFDKSGKYRPVSTLVKVANKEEFLQDKEKVKYAGVKKIMIQRGWSTKDLLKYNFLYCKMRVYEEE